MDTFGEWLRQQRNNRRLTRDEFSKRVGCSIALLRKIEDGERHPSVQIAGLIANCLEIAPENRSIFVRVARGELSLDRLTTLEKPNVYKESARVNLPIYPTPLIGRRHEIEELIQFLREPQCHLLTLFGLGGVGKTRLAVETASLVQDDFADGIFFISLASVSTARFILPVIADAIGFSFQSNSNADPKAQLLKYLKEKQMLLLIDNLEHLLYGPGIELLADIISNSPLVKLLAASRETIGLQDEWCYEVQGLPIPEGQYIQGNEQDTSVELFLQRARRAYIGFSPTVENYPAIIRICNLVGGLPLAIELAAAWVHTLSCEEIASEIEHGLDFLKVSMRDLPTRHHSMRAVFNQSWILLTADEPSVMERLSIFQGGFVREAAEEVAGAQLSTLSSLVTKSFIRRNSQGRFDLHELIHQYASEQLDQHPQDQIATEALHGKYYLNYFRNAYDRLQSPEQREVLVNLIGEMDNFRAAWRWAIAHVEFSLIEETLRTFTILYDLLGWYQEGIDTLDHAAAILEKPHNHLLLDRSNQVTLAHILTCSSYIKFRYGLVNEAQRMLERSVEILIPLNEPRVLVEALAYLGLVMIWMGNFSKALELFAEGVEVAKAIDDRWFSLLCLTHQANISVMMSNSEEGYRRLQSAVENWRLIGDLHYIAYALNLLGLSASVLGRHAEARTAMEECVKLNISVGDYWGLGFGYQGLGRVAQAQGQHQEAVEMYSKGLETFSQLGSRRDVARALVDMGRSHFALGNDTEAQQVWLKAIQIASETQGAHVALEALVGIARLQAKRGHLEYAYAMLLIVINNPSSVQETQNRAAQLKTELEVQLTEKQITDAYAWAQTKNLEAIIDDFLIQSRES